jgi:hypothetical protein
MTEAFADHFCFVFNSSSSVNTLNNSDYTSSDFFNIPYNSDTDIKQAISHLHSTKCIRPDEIPNFIVKGCSEILCHIFNLSLLAGSFPLLWKQVALVPIFKKDNSSFVTN